MITILAQIVSLLIGVAWLGANLYLNYRLRKQRDSYAPVIAIVTSFLAFGLLVFFQWLGLPILRAIFTSFEGVVSLLLFASVFALIVFLSKETHRHSLLREKHLNQEVAKERQRQKDKLPEAILSGSPTAYQIERILHQHPDNFGLRRLAFEAAMRSDNTWLVSRAMTVLPEYHDELLHHWEEIYVVGLPADQLANWSNKESLSLRNPKIGQMIDAAQAKMEAEAAEKERIQRATKKLQAAEANDHDVCWKCLSIDPDRCEYCGACTEGCRSSNGKYCSVCQRKNPCGDPTCGGYCSYCDDD